MNKKTHHISLCYADSSVTGDKLHTGVVVWCDDGQDDWMDRAE